MSRNPPTLFYRTFGLSGASEDLPARLRFRIVHSAAGWRVLVHNPTNQRARFSSATLSVNGKYIGLSSSAVAATDVSEWWPDAEAPLPPGSHVINALLIHDFGASVNVRQALRFPQPGGRLPHPAATPLG